MGSKGRGGREREISSVENPFQEFIVKVNKEIILQPERNVGSGIVSVYLYTYTVMEMIQKKKK